MDLQGRIDLDNPEQVFTYFEDYGTELDPLRTENPSPFCFYVGRWIANGNRPLVAQYDLKKRNYLGTTSMDAELSLVMANMALVRQGSFVLDPFVGTGSFLVSCSHFGAYSIGSGTFLVI